MAQTIYTQALARAAEAQGSTQALASLLRVPENTLLRWMSGRAQMPLQAFLRLIELIAQHEKKQAPEPSAAGAIDGERLRFSVGEFEARCPRCDSSDFRRADPAFALRYTSPLLCCACGGSAVHGDLLVQLAKDAVYHSRAMTVARNKPRRAPATAGPRPQSPAPVPARPGEPAEKADR